MPDEFCSVPNGHSKSFGLGITGFLRHKHGDNLVRQTINHPKFDQTWMGQTNTVWRSVIGIPHVGYRLVARLRHCQPQARELQECAVLVQHFGSSGVKATERSFNSENSELFNQDFWLYPSVFIYPMKSNDIPNLVNSNTPNGPWFEILFMFNHMWDDDPQ